MSEIKSLDDVFSSSNRHVLFPIKYPKLFQNYKNLLNTFWTVDEIDFSKDKFEELDPNEQYFIKMILAFFASADGVVNENIALNMYNLTEIPEVRQFYATQMMNEAVHNEMYSLMIDAYIKSPEEQIEIFNAANNTEKYGFLKHKKDWVESWIQNKDATKLERLIASVITEGVLFSGSFAAIFWFKQSNRLPALTISNQLISRDENIHAQEVCDVYKLVPNHLRLPKEHVYKIFNEAVNIETKFMTKSLPVSLIGMNSDKMIQYIKFVADYWLFQLEYPVLFKAENPFPFMVTLGMESKTNFFERRVTDYNKVIETKTNFVLDDAF
jgi:ribonucleotide reductase beta subunit family protein with ferritin-like domain